MTRAASTGVALALVLALGGPRFVAHASELLVVEHAVVAADNPDASRVGVDILRSGGNAVDAAVAVGLALGVVNPFASGLGGGGFMLVRDPGTGEVAVLDFRELAPAAAHRDMFVVEGIALPGLSREGGLAVAVPGELAGWWAAHQRFGRLPWSEVVEPARRLASDGFSTGPLLAQRLADLDAPPPRLVGEFSVDDGLAQRDETLTRPGLGRTLRAIQEQGPDGFYRGWVAADIVDTASDAGGVLTLADLESYAVRWLEPVISTYRGHQVYGMPPPSSGGLAIAQILGTLEGFQLSRGAYDDPITAHIVMQAFAFAFADRAAHLGDPDFWSVPWERFVGGARSAEALGSYDPVRTLPPDAYGPLSAGVRDGGTSHFSIVDSDGMAVACTVTINTSFGSLVVGEASGVVLNNEMDDFSAQPGVPNAFGLVGGEANAIAPGKRPLSSMSPSIVVRDGALVGTLGGSGGPMIITETVLGLVQMIDFGADAAQAVASLRFHHQWLPPIATVEAGHGDAWTDALESLGYELAVVPFSSALQVVWRHPLGWQAASDPRKHGAPAGY